MKVDLSEVIDALDNSMDGVSYYYYIPEECIVIENWDGLWISDRCLHGDDVEDLEEDLISLPDRYEINEYGIMQDFIEEKTKGQAKEWLENAVRGKGAFRRFRSTLERFNLIEKWYDYRERALRSKAILWCEDNGIEYYETKEYFDEDLEDDEYFDPEEDVTYVKVQANEPMHIIAVTEKNMHHILYMVQEFRKVLSSFKDRQNENTPEDAEEEIRYYLKKEYPVFAVSQDGLFTGYAVCRIEDDCVWLESIYVREKHRRKGVGAMLFHHAEEIALEHGNDTLYNYVHPNNDRMLGFLKKMGYDVLNLIEIRKKAAEETLSTAYTIGNQTYRY